MVARAGFNGWIGWGRVRIGPALATTREAIAIITLLWGPCPLCLMRHWKWVLWGGVLTLRGRAEGSVNSGAQLQLWMYTRLFPWISATNPTKPATVHMYKFDRNLCRRGFWRQYLQIDSVNIYQMNSRYILGSDCYCNGKLTCWNRKKTQNVSFKTLESVSCWAYHIYINIEAMKFSWQLSLSIYPWFMLKWFCILQNNDRSAA